MELESYHDECRGLGHLVLRPILPLEALRELHEPKERVVLSSSGVDQYLMELVFPRSYRCELSGRTVLRAEACLRTALRNR